MEAINGLATDGVVMVAEKITSMLLVLLLFRMILTVLFLLLLCAQQVEYAMEAISHAGAAVGILATDGVVLVAEKKITSKLLETSKTTEKMYKIDDHVAAAVAGITADANILINSARLAAQRYYFTYQVQCSILSCITVLYCTVRDLLRAPRCAALLFHIPGTVQHAELQGTVLYMKI